MAGKAGEAIERLVGIMARLRAEGGCPWDREQDIRTLRPYLIEEAFEVVDEMDRVGAGGAWAPYCEELGDLLFQIVFHAQLARELDEFDLGDVANAISDKIVRRHPHVFPAGDEKAHMPKDAEQVLANWAQLKAEERKQKTGRAGSVLDGVPTFAPSLMRAERLTEKASRIGFDWPDLESVRAKVDEELAELDDAAKEGDPRKIEDELGDVLFSIVNLARFLKAPAEDALRQTLRKFVRRFQHVEHGLQEAKVPFGKATLEQMDALWNDAKRGERERPPAPVAPRADVGGVVIDCASIPELEAFWRTAGPVLGLAQLPAGAGEVRLGHPRLNVRYRLREGARPSGISLHLSVPDAFVPATVSALEQSGVAVSRNGQPSFRDPAGVTWTFGAN